jgi:hypothetical protein
MILAEATIGTELPEVQPVAKEMNLNVQKDSLK